MGSPLRFAAYRLMLIRFRVEPQLCFSVWLRLTEFGELAHKWHTKKECFAYCRRPRGFETRHSTLYGRYARVSERFEFLLEWRPIFPIGFTFLLLL